MSVPGLPDRAAYDVIYRARWDGNDLAEGAAKARAEIDALQRSNTDLNRAQTQEARAATEAAKSRKVAEEQLTKTLREQAAAREQLNKAESKGYASPEQYLAYQQKEVQQQQALNKARNNGRDTPDQVVADIKNETAAIQQKSQQVSTLATFFEELAVAQTNASKSDPFATDRGQASKNLKSYADQVKAVISGLQSAVQNDPFTNGQQLKTASLNVKAFADGIKNIISGVNKEIDSVGSGKSTRTSFFTSFSNTTKDIERGLKGISEQAKKAAKDGEESVSELDTAWEKFKFTLDAVGSSVKSVFSGGSGGMGGGFGSLFASGASAGGSFLQLISSAIPAVTSLWGILAMGVTIFPLVISGVLAIATGVLGLTASIGTLLTVAGALIPMFVALAGAALVVQQAVQPVVKAVTELGKATNAAQVQKALQGLSPAAQSAALALNTLQQAFKGTGSGLEQAFWTPVLPSLKNIKEIATPLNQLLRALAGSVGSVFGQMLTGVEKFTKSPGFQVLVGGAKETVSNLGNAFVNVADIVTKLAVAGTPVTNFITTGVDDLTKSLNRFITTAAHDGSLSKFFDTVIGRMQLLGDIFSNAFGGLKNLLTAFLPVGDAFLQQIDKWARRFDELSKNRKGLAEWAKDAIPFLQSLGNLLAGIVGGIIRLGSNPQNLKDLTDVFQGLVKIVGPLFSLAQAIFDLFARFAAVAAPLVGSALAGFARAIQDVANWVRDIETHRAGIDTLKTLLGVFGGLVVSASLVNFIGKLVLLAGSSWGSVQKVLGFLRGGFGGGSSGGSDNPGDNPAQAAADTQLKAAQMNLTASENNLKAAGLMDTAATENVAAGDEMGAAVVGGSANGKSFGKGLLSVLSLLGGSLVLGMGNSAVNGGTLPDSGGRLLGEAGTNVAGGALVGAGVAGLPGAVVGGIIGGVKAIFDNGPYLDKLLNAFNPAANARSNLYGGPVGNTFLTPKGTKIDPVTGVPFNQAFDVGMMNGTVVTPQELANLASTFASQVPHVPNTDARVLPPILTGTPNTRTFLQPSQQPGDPRANPGFGYGSDKKPILDLSSLFNPVERFFRKDVPQWSKDVWHAVQNFFTGPFVRFFEDTIPHAAGAAWRWFVSQNKQIWNQIKEDALGQWHKIIDPAWQAFDRNVYQPIEKFVMRTLPSFFTQTIPRWWDTAYGAFMRNIGTPVSNFITKSIPNFFTQTIPQWWNTAYGAFMRNVGSPISNFITKSIPSFFTQTIPKWFDSVSSWVDKKVVKPIEDVFTNSIPNTIQQGFKGAINWVIKNIIGTGGNPGGMIGLLNKATGVVGVHIPGVPMLATGGKVPGPDYIDHDAVYAKLTPGEFVIRKKAAQRLGPGVLNWLNHADAHMARFASGGPVGWLTGQNEASSALSALSGVGNFFQGALRSGFDGLWNATVGNLLKPLGQDNVPAAVANYAASFVKKGVDSFLGAKDSSFMKNLGSLAGSLGSSASALLAQAYAANLLPTFGWGSDQMPSLIKLWNQESGWNANAVNPTSGAYGIPQSLGHGHPFNLGDYQAQIRWGLDYIKQTYGSPSAAWAHEQRYNWYNSGGFVMPDFGAGFARPVSPHISASTPGRLSQAAQSINNSRSIGLNVETMQINNPIRETAGQSVQRQLVKNRTYAGRR